MYSLTIFTTIGNIIFFSKSTPSEAFLLPFLLSLFEVFSPGYGNLTTRTALGKVSPLNISFWKIFVKKIGHFGGLIVLTRLYRWSRYYTHWLEFPLCSSTWPILAVSSPPPSSTPTQRCAGVILIHFTHLCWNIRSWTLTYNFNFRFRMWYLWALEVDVSKRSSRHYILKVRRWARGTPKEGNFALNYNCQGRIHNHIGWRNH